MPAPRPRRRIGMAGIAIIALLGMPTAAIAVDGTAAQQFKHYIDCLGWLLTDLPTHTANCTPSRPFEFPEQHGGGEPNFIRLLSPSAWSESAPPSSSQTSQPSSSSSEEEPPCTNPELCPEPPCTNPEECPPPPCDDPYSCPV